MNIELESLSREINLNNCPVLKKNIRKIIIFDSKPNKYALYIEETDRFILISEKEIDRIIQISKLTDGHNNISKILNVVKFDKKDTIRSVLLMYKLHLFDDSQKNSNLVKQVFYPKKYVLFH